MKEEIALRVIEEIKNNPGIHYIELREKTKNYMQEEALYRLLYSISHTPREGPNCQIIKAKETDRYYVKLLYGVELVRSIERSKFEFVCERDKLAEKLDEQFMFWKLGQDPD